MGLESCSPSMTEIRETLKKLRNNKGLEKMEFLMNTIRMWGNGWSLVTVRAVHQLYKRVWEEAAVPLKLNESRVLLLHKGGNKNKQLLQNLDQFPW